MSLSLLKCEKQKGRALEGVAAESALRASCPLVISFAYDRDVAPSSPAVKEGWPKHMQTWHSAIITSGRYSRNCGGRNPFGSEADFQSAGYCAAGNYGDVVRLTRLIVEKILAMKIERESATKSVIEVSAEAGDTFVLSPVRA